MENWFQLDNVTIITCYNGKIVISEEVSYDIGKSKF